MAPNKLSAEMIREGPYLLPKRIPVVNPSSRLFITCEHATNQLPLEYKPNKRDIEFLDTHWGWDPGAAEVTEELCRLTGAGAVLSAVSRLVCDVNRRIDDDTLILRNLEGHDLTFNKDVDVDEIQKRVERYYIPFHMAVHDHLQNRLCHSPPPLLLAVHSFTPNYMGDVREMEIGIIYDKRCPEKARLLHEAFRAKGFNVALNSPYSGMDGQMYSAWHHGNGNGIDYLELEMRQDLFAPDVKAENIGRIVEAINYASKS